MSVTKLREIGRFCARRFDCPAVLAGLSGWIGGTYLCAWSLGVMGYLGTSLAVQTGMAVAFLLAVLLGCRIPLSQRFPLGGVWGAFACAHFGLAALAVCVPTFFEWIPSIAACAGDAWIDSPLVVASFSALVSGLLIGVPTFCIVRMPRWLSVCECRKAADPGSGTGHALTVWFLCGAGIGLLADSLILAPLLDFQVTVLIAALSGGVLFVCGATWALKQSSDPLRATMPVVVPGRASRSAKLEGDLEGGANSMAALAGEWFFLGCVAVAIGMSSAAGMRMIHQIVPQTTYLLISQWSFLILGTAAGLIWADRLQRRDMGQGQGQVKVLVCLVLGAWTSCLLAAFPWLVYRILWMNSRFSQIWILLLVRACLPGLFAAPTGILLGLCLGALRRAEGSEGTASNRGRWTGRDSAPFEFASVVGLAAYVCARGSLIGHWGVAWTLWGSAAMLVLGSIILLLVSWRLPQSWQACTCAIASILVVAVAPAWRGNYQPALSARLLFNSNVLVAAQKRIHPRTLCFLDEGRNIGWTEGAQGTFTLWRYSSAQYQIRENGIPVGLASSDTEIHPNYSAETLPTTIPLVLHQQPKRVLLLGLGTGAALNKFLASPVQSITCVERDRGRVDLVRAMLENTPESIDWNDERLGLRTVDPMLLLTTSAESFDVIVSNADSASLHSNGMHYTREFYMRAARRLSSDGIFCQRFQSVDYGAGPMRSMIRTLQAAFAEVAAFEMAPGEFLFAATNAPQGLIRPALIARLRMPHIRRILSETGWDWSLPLTLTAYDQKGLKKIADAGAAQVNTVLSGHFAMRLPQEVMRWGTKAQELQAALEPELSHLAQWIGADAEKQDVLRRVSELAGGQTVMNKFPDQYWAYRKHLREHMTGSPLASVRQVNYEDDGEPDPDDKRRLQYFTALGVAARSLRIEDIRRVAEFQTPFDPMLTYFLHPELAELYAKARHLDPRQELRHRMHAAYYASPSDSSIHNLVDAIRLLLDYPESAPAKADRFDQLNSLLQALRTRWDLRGSMKQGIPKHVLRDVDLSLVAAEKAVDCLEGLAPDVGLSPDDWSYRLEVIEKSLLSPLRSYREALIPYVGRERILETQGDSDTGQ